MNNYFDILDQDKKIASQNILLNNGYLIHENFNAGKIRCVEICKNDRYGLTSVLFSMISAMNITNEKIVESNNLYKEIKNNGERIMYLNTYCYAKYHRLLESIVHDIKSFCDKLIIISYLIIEDEVVNDLKVKSISGYFNDNHHYFESDESFLHLINDLDNSFKHSFSNDMDPGRIGMFDNCVVNYYSKNGKNIFNPIVISVKLDDIVNGFNNFFDSVEKFCKENTIC